MISIVGVALGLSLPLLSLVLENRHVPGWLNGLNAAMAALANIIVSPFVPGLMRRCGSRRFIFLCLALALASLPALRWFDSLAAWFVLRFLLGAALAGLFVISEIWLNFYAEDSSRARLLGLYSTALSAAFALGSFIVSMTRVDSWTPFLVGAAVIALGSLPVLALGRTAPSVGEDRQSLAATLDKLRRSPIIFLTPLVFATIEVGLFGLMPVYGVRAGLDPEAAVLMVTVGVCGSMAAQFPVGWWADHSNPLTVLKICSLGGIAGSLLTPALTGTVWLWPLIFVWAGLMGGLYIVGLTAVARLYPGADLPGANAAYVSMYGVGMLIGPPVGGWAMDMWNPHGLVYSVCLFFGPYLLLLMMGRKSA